LLELIFEFILEFLFQVIVEIGFESFAEIFRRRRSLPIPVSMIVIAVVGGVVGFFWSNMFPQRILSKPAVPGISLLRHRSAQV